MRRSTKAPAPLRPHGVRHYSLEIGAETFERAMAYDGVQAMVMSVAVSLAAATVVFGLANYVGRLGFDGIVLGLTVGDLGFFAIALVRAHMRAEMLEHTMFQAAVDALHRSQGKTFGAFDRLRRLAGRP